MLSNVEAPNISSIITLIINIRWHYVLLSSLLLHLLFHEYKIAGSRWWFSLSKYEASQQATTTKTTGKRSLYQWTKNPLPHPICMIHIYFYFNGMLDMFFNHLYSIRLALTITWWTAQILRRRLKDMRTGELRALKMFNGLRKLFK